MINKDIETRLMEMYIRGWITKEALEEKLNKLDKKDGIKKPPVIY